MPIRINLLAEAQLAEDLRRRDPVKRAIYVGAFLVVVMLVWSSSLLLENMIASRDLNQVQISIDSKTNSYQHALADQGKVNDIQNRLAALSRLANSRFLQGNLLDALQKTTVDNVQLMRIRVDQSYYKTEAVAAKANSDPPVAGRPATATEKIVLTLDAKDSSATPGDAVNKFKDVIANQPYFKAMLGKTSAVQLTSLSPPQVGSDGRPYVLFTIECDFPQQTR